MNSLFPSRSRASRSARSAALQVATGPDLNWIHDGVRHRVTVWPEVRFEFEGTPGVWREGEFAATAFASTALGVTAAQWRRYLEFVPVAERKFLEGFSYGRMAALHVIVRCPELFFTLATTPALTAFLSIHLNLRGGEEPRWAEITAVFEREGLFGLLQWLGLPASRQTLSILGNIEDPDLPQRLLGPLRAALWDPTTIWALARAQHLTDERIAETCHALAA